MAVMNIATTPRVAEILASATRLTLTERIYVARTLLDSVLPKEDGDWNTLSLSAFEKGWDNEEDETWQEEFRALQKQVRASGGLNLGTTKEEVIETLRKQRQDIFEAEYAHLYR